MPRPPAPFVQRLIAADLAIERATERTPDTRRYHVFQGDRLVGSFRSLTEAQRVFGELRDSSGWQPPEPEDLDAEERLRREREARDRLDYLDYWGSAHQFRGGGRPKRRQR